MDGKILPSKKAATEGAALRLRVQARKAGYMTVDMAWNIIAEYQTLTGCTVALSAKAVIAKAQAELRANGERIEIRP